MRRVVSAFSVLALSALLVLAGCAGKGGTTAPQGGTAGPTAEAPQAGELQPEPGAQLLFWESGGAVGEWAKYVAEEFSKRYGVPVTYEEVSHVDTPGKLKTDGPAGLGADVFAAPHDHLGELVAGGLIEENAAPPDYAKDFLPATIQGTTYEGKLWGYPTAIETYALIYNKDLVKEVPKTWDELLAQAKAHTDVQKNTYGFMMEPANFYFAYAFFGGYGGYVFGDHNTNPADIGLNNEGSVKAGEFLQRIHREVLPLKVEDVTYDAKEGLFKSGKLMYNVNGPWAVDDYRKANVNFGVAPLPLLDNGNHPTSFSGIRALYVNAYTKYPKAAALFAQFATSEEMLLKLYEMTGMLPARASLLQNPEIQGNEAVRGFLEQAQYAVPMPNIPQMSAVWTPMSSALTTIWNDNANVKQALDAAVKQIRDAVQAQSSGR